MFEHFGQDHAVEDRIVERQSMGVCADVVRCAESRSSRGGCRCHRAIDAGDRESTASERLGHEPASASHVEHRAGVGPMELVGDERHPHRIEKLVQPEQKPVGIPPIVAIERIVRAAS